MFDSKQLKAFALDLFFPNRCPLCGNVINWKIEYCDSCYDKLPYTGDELCHGCGNEISRCICHDSERFFSRCYAAFYYQDSAKGGVIYLKSTKNDVFPRLFADKTSEDIKADAFFSKADCIVPVPMSKLKLRRRGFNQAEVLADALGEKLGIPVCRQALLKSESVIAQHKLSANRRKSNAARLYYAGNAAEIKEKTVIIVDDVMTTGSTINSCAEILLEMGANSVIAAVAATTV